MNQPFLKILILLFLPSSFIFSQVTGGLHAFESFSLPQTARITSLGGAVISIMDSDVALASQNPALINEKMNGQLSINNNFVFAGISSAYIGYGHRLKKLGFDMHFAIQSNSFGEFVLADEIGNKQGTFKASEIGFITGASKQINERIRLGLNLKYAVGSYESYGSSAIASDIGILYGVQSDTSIQIGLVFKNIGTSLSSLGTENNATPFDVQIGFAKKLAHLPFRFSIIAHSIHRWDIRYDDPALQTTNFIGESEESSPANQAIDNIFRHLIFSGAFLFGQAEQFRLRFAYNHLRKKELSVSSFRSLGGFSVGFGFNIKKIKFDYGVGYHHLAGGNNHLSLRIDLNRFYKKI